MQRKTNKALTVTKQLWYPVRPKSGLHGPGSWKEFWNIQWKNTVLLTLTSWYLTSILIKTGGRDSREMSVAKRNLREGIKFLECSVIPKPWGNILECRPLLQTLCDCVRLSGIKTDFVQGQKPCVLHMLFSRWLIGLLYFEVFWGWKSPTQWTGNWKHPKRNNMFFGLFTVWMTVWKAAQQNTGVLLGIWSEGLFVLLSLVVNAVSRSNVYSTSWMDEALEESRKTWHYISIMTPANSMDARIQIYSLHLLGPDRFLLLFRESHSNILETAKHRVRHE